MGNNLGGRWDDEKEGYFYAIVVGRGHFCGAFAAFHISMDRGMTGDEKNNMNFHDLEMESGKTKIEMRRWYWLL